jgi:long-chain acyl-CoA synthetase
MINKELRRQRNIINRLTHGDRLRSCASTFPGREAFVAYGPQYEYPGLERRLTFAEADRKANRIANALIERGYGKGDRLAMIMGNSIEFLLVHFGAAKAGLTLVPINLGITPQDLEYQLEHSESKLVVIDGDLQPKFAETVKKLRLPYMVVPISGMGEGETLKEFMQGASDTEPEVEIWERDIVQMQYTSGTTALPKAVMHSHMNLIMGGVNAVFVSGFSGVDLSSVTCSCLMPLFHCAQQALSYGPFLCYGKNVIFRGYDPELLLQGIQDEKITQLFMLSSLYKDLAGRDPLRYDLSSLTHGIYAMTPIEEETKRRWIEEYNVQLIMGAGQTEAMPATEGAWPEYQLKRQGNWWGIPAPFAEHQIMDEKGNLLGDNQSGELVVRGPVVCEGYLKNQEETKRISEHGWHHFGDIMLRDEEGLYLFLDRKKDIIKTGGENVATMELDSLIGAHPKVSEAVVVGLPHEKWGEAVTCFVVSKDPSLTEEELINYCKERLAKFKVPKKVVFVDQVPKTSTGKIQKYQLRQQYNELYSGSSA